MHPVRGSHLRRDARPRGSAAGVRARLPDARADVRRSRRSGVRSLACDPRTRRLCPAARARTQAREPLPSAAPAEAGAERRGPARVARPRAREPGESRHPPLKPALSIVFFTVSSGAGLGLLALITLADLFTPGTLTARVEWRGALLGLVLVALGLASSVLHLANPKNAWGSFARFRTSWLSREAVFAAALFPIAAAFLSLVVAGTIGG